MRETGRSRRSPEGVEGRGHAQRASEAPEHRAAVREAKGRLGPGNLEGEARKYAGPYPRAAKGECAGETGEGGAKIRNTGPLKASTVRRRGLTMPHCGTVARRSRDGGIGQTTAQRHPLSRLTPTAPLDAKGSLLARRSRDGGIDRPPAALPARPQKAARKRAAGFPRPTVSRHPLEWLHR